MQHLSTEQLIGYANDGPPAQELQSMNEHLRECEICAGTLREWSGIFSAMKDFRLRSAPPEAIRQCLAIYAIPKPGVRLREILATLIFDSLAQPVAPGVRGGDDVRQVLLRAEDVDLHLRFSQSPNLILGQLLQRSDRRFVAGARIEISRDGETVGTTVTDSLGEFRFKDVPGGTLKLCADLASQLRVIAVLPGGRG